MELKQNAPAKINLGLHVLRRRADGYHDIETVFLRIPWSDFITVRPAGDVSMTCSDPSLPVDERNLCLLAARRWREASGTGEGAHLHLEKRIPYGAGLGGGSSDAAATLRLLTELWNRDVPQSELQRVALELGSDVPFFLNGPAAVAEGRGELLSPLIDRTDHTPYLLPYSLVVIVPEVHVSTAKAYSLVTPRAENRPDLADIVLSNDLERWRRELVNDFEAPVFAEYPVVAELKTLLLHAGAGYASLSGSGSAVYGVFEDDTLARAAAETARHTGHNVWHGRMEE